MTLLEQFAKISEANEDLLNQWAEKYKIAQRLIEQQKEQIVSLRNENFRLKERLRTKNEKSKRVHGEFPSSATDA